MNLCRQPHSGYLRRRIEKDNILLFESLIPSPCGYSPCIPLWEHPVKLRDTAGGEGDALIRSLCCGYFWTPPSLRTPPYMANATHPVALRGKSSQSKRINPYSQKTCEIFPTLLLYLRWRIEAGEKEKCNPSYSLKFMSISTKFLLSRLSFPLLRKNISLYGT